MLDDQPSHTAQRVALRRASHQLLDRPLVFRDPLALAIVGKEAAAALRADPQRFERSRLSPYLRAFFAVRSHMAEEQLGRVECALLRGSH
jgi:O-methyltransferase involved in polyketide biosynthesis